MIWQYVKKFKLQDPNNVSHFRLDEKLKSVLKLRDGKKTFNCADIASVCSKHLLDQVEAAKLEGIDLDQVGVEDNPSLLPTKAARPPLPRKIVVCERLRPMLTNFDITVNTFRYTNV